MRCADQHIYLTAWDGPDPAASQQLSDRTDPAKYHVATAIVASKQFTARPCLSQPYKMKQAASAEMLNCINMMTPCVLPQN